MADDFANALKISGLSSTPEHHKEIAILKELIPAGKSCGSMHLRTGAVVWPQSGAKNQPHGAEAYFLQPLKDYKYPPAVSLILHKNSSLKFSPLVHRVQAGALSCGEMASLMKFVFTSLRRIRAPEDSPSTSSSTHTTRHSGGPFTMGVPCNPESGIGLLAAVAEPASTYLRVAHKPVITHTGIRGILAVTDDLCCNGACGSVYCCGTMELEARTSRINRTCRLCSRRLDGGRVYMYKGLMFCTRVCRFDYFMEALYDKRHREQIGVPPSNGIRADVKESLVPREEKKSFMKIFSG